MSKITLKDLAENNKILKNYIESSKDFYNLFGIELDKAQYGIEGQMLTFEARSSHGGAISALLDSVTGVTGLTEASMKGKIVLTSKLEVEMLKKSIPGQKFICIGSISDKVIKTSGVLRDENEVVYAQAEAVLICK